MNSHTTSRLLSKIFDKNASSIYETIRENDTAPYSDLDFDEIEEEAGLFPKGPQFSDLDSSKIDNKATQLERLTYRDTHRPGTLPNSHRRTFTAVSGSSRTPPLSRHRKEDDDNAEVPQSLLFESESASHDRSQNHNEQSGRTKWTLPPLSTTDINGERRMSREEPSPRHEPGFRRNQPHLGLMDPKERALWKWANVENLDNFLHDVRISVFGATLK